MPPLPSTARAQIFDGPGRSLRLEALSLPTSLAPGEVLTEIQLATICASDLHTIAGHRIEPTPCILGHEAVGRVVATGAGRARLRPGDRITWSIADSCGACAPCTRHHLPEKCEQLFKYGHASTSDGSGLNGCYASHILLRPGTHIVRVGEHLPDSVLAPVNCALSTMVNATWHLPDPCQTVAIQGAGLLGLYGCALLRRRGIKVFCVDVQPQRLEQVERFGGIPVDGRPEYYPHSCKQIQDAAPHGVDAVLEVAGVAALVPAGIQLLRPGGLYAFVGMVHPDTQLELTGEQVIRKCLTLRGVHNYSPHHLDQAVEFLHNTADHYPYESLVSPPFPLAELESAVQAARSRAYFRVSIRQEPQ